MSSGRVSFNEEAITVDIQVHPHYVYDIDLERCTDAAGLLNWLLQVRMKTWCTPELFDEVLKCIDDVAWLLFRRSLQGLICPGGAMRIVDWKAAVESGKRYHPLDR